MKDMRARIKENWRRIAECLETSKTSGSFGRSELSEPDKNGVRWVRNGGNASHEFRLGIDAQGNLWEESYGPSGNLDMSKFPSAFDVYHPRETIPAVPAEHLEHCYLCSEEVFWESSRTEIRKIQDPKIG